MPGQFKNARAEIVKELHQENRSQALSDPKEEFRRFKARIEKIKQAALRDFKRAKDLKENESHAFFIGRNSERNYQDAIEEQLIEYGAVSPNS